MSAKKSSSDETSVSDIKLVKESRSNGRKKIREIADETDLQVMSIPALYDLTFLRLSIICSNSGCDQSCGKGRGEKEATYSRKTEAVQ